MAAAPIPSHAGRTALAAAWALCAALALHLAPPAEAGEKLNCLMCHKYRGLSRVDEQGRFRLFYVNKEMFESGPHRRVGCGDCHSDIDRIPHKTPKPVDCTQQCHVVEPSGRLMFSHKATADTLARSVHGKLQPDGTPKAHPEDYPSCKDCHEEPLYRPLSVFKGVPKHGVSQRSIGTCKACHKGENFAEDFYKHVTSRLQRNHSPLDTIDRCAKCHQDPGLRQRHRLDDAVTTYKQTFHGKLLLLGSKRTPDCIDCHVVEGENNHLIEARTRAPAATNPENLGKTCRTSDCHFSAGAQLAGFQTHVTYEREKYPLQFYMLLFFKGLMALVLYFFLALILLELMRRLFPKFAFFDDNTPHHQGPASGNDKPEA